MREFNHFTVDGRRVFDVRRNDKFTEPEVTHVPIQPPEPEVDEAMADIRSEQGSVVGSEAGSLASVTGPGEIITYPTPDCRGLLVNVSNPNLCGWLPPNPKRDYNCHTLPNGAVVVTSESLGLLKFALGTCLNACGSLSVTRQIDC